MAELDCAKSIAELADLWCRMDAHEGQAAWAGAIGTVLAILASSAFAIWVPIHMEARSQRNQTQRAINSLIVGVGSTQAAIEAAIAATKEDILGTATELIQPQIDASRRALAQVSESLMLGEAFRVMATCEMQLQLLTSTLARADSRPAERVMEVLQAIHAELAVVSNDCMALEPKNLQGHWMIHGPADDEGIAEAKVISRAARTAARSRGT